jgi:myo-inositol-1(or 4)-monophosphatase
LNQSDALELVRDSLRAAQRAVAESLADRGREYTGTVGYFGDATLLVDRAAEDAVLSVVRRALPDAYVVTEEAGIEGEGRGGPLVLLDPVDGSMNARRGIPVFSTAIAVTRPGGRRYGDVIAAGVLNHSTGEIIWGDPSGVYVGWTPASPSGVERLEEAVVDLQSQTHAAGGDEARGLARILGRTKYPRILGSAALGIAYVAAGRIDAFVAHYGGLRTFDCVPSLFLLESAGGHLAVLEPANLDSLRLDSFERVRVIAAGSGALLEEIARELGLGPGVTIRGGRASR